MVCKLNIIHNDFSYSLEIHLVHSLQQNGTFDPESDPFKRLSVVALLFEV